ncbi:hypothetical protein AB0C91_24340 [Streptomyces sp. NPDC048674]|uniref:hypothetical protein n=1 Tax=Streptomyces sp. NPDC048674 TaxID=3155491 RepID=UPI00342210D6
MGEAARPLRGRRAVPPSQQQPQPAGAVGAEDGKDVAYNGNGQEQHDFLAELRALALDSNFPDELAPELSLFLRSEVG